MNVAEHLTWMRERVAAGEPFYHTRYNDGEIYQMLGLRPAGSWASESRYHDDLGAALRAAFLAACADRTGRVLVGSILATDPAHETARALAAWLAGQGVDWAAVRSTAGEFWCQEEDLAPGIVELIDALRQTKRCVLVCNGTVEPARHCLKARTVLVSNRDSWAGMRSLGRSLARTLKPGAIVLWAAGIAAKAWSWDVWRLRPDVTHLDVGHTFDGVFGLRSRGWMSRDTPMSRHYFGPFAEYVRSFLP